MKLIVVAVLAAGQMASAAFFGSGTYEGNGLWQSKTAERNYKVVLSVDGDKLKSVYTLPDGTTKEASFEFSSKEGNFFDVNSHGAKIGTGYCIKFVDVCHYTLNLKPYNVGIDSLEETYVIHNGRYYRYGSKVMTGGEEIFWQEDLEKK